MRKVLQYFPESIGVLSVRDWRDVWTRLVFFPYLRVIQFYLDMDTENLYQLFIKHPVVTTDSRHCPEGSLFFALKGERFDGNQYAAAALEKGCAYAVIDNPEYLSGDRTILVDDTLRALQALAREHRDRLGLPVIGITGTNGKTTTKELIAAVLSTQYNLLYTEGNLNNHIGVPLTLLRLRETHQLAVIEMGASHPGDIRELVEIAHPNYGLITNVGQAHLQGFGSFDGVIRTKGELYDYLRAHGGEIFIREEDEILRGIAQGLPQTTYGSGEEAFIHGRLTEVNPFLSLEWQEKGTDESYPVDTHLIGGYNIHNVLAAIAIGRYFKVPADRINQAIAAYTPTNNRSQFQQTERNSLVIDAYNANPSSMRAALENFGAMPGAPKALILGDMRELGPESDRLHAEIVRLIDAGHYDRVYLCGEHFSAVGSGYRCFQSTEALLETLEREPLTGYHILIKGSRGIGLERTLKFL